MIARTIAPAIRKRLSDKKAIIILGPRQTGKTTLIREVLKTEGAYLFLNGDDGLVREELENTNTEKIRQLLGQFKIVFIDEAQRIENIGLALKIITDQFNDVRLIVSGSSALELNQKINEPLTGRKWEYKLFPISWQEFQNHYGYLAAKQQLELRLIYGMYPDVINAHANGEEKEVLQQLATSYLYKDVLTIGGLRKPDIIVKLLQALAYQLGNEISYNELANMLQIDKNTVSHYLDILEKTFVIFRLTSFSRNPRKEISTSKKIYFYDNGIRNSLISNFSALTFRRDKGALWENFLISERMKLNHYYHSYANTFFWRTKQQQEIDYLEDSEGVLKAYEFKYSSNSKAKVPLTFTRLYPDASFEIVNPDNFLSFIMPNS
ncbi:MAG: ATP-binding protein [Fulvivirga sp.]|uniref:ATP-binding protein n=1 Tax=Fulvivirga sp. TaxID=1931237 RepID=UPI0032EDB6E7